MTGMRCSLWRKTRESFDQCVPASVIFQQVNSVGKDLKPQCAETMGNHYNNKPPLYF